MILLFGALKLSTCRGLRAACCDGLVKGVGILQYSLESAALFVGIEYAVLIGVLSLPASVKFRLVFWNLSGLCGVILSLCSFCGVSTKVSAEFGGFFGVSLESLLSLRFRFESGRRNSVSTAVSPAVCGSSDALDLISGSRTSKLRPRQAAPWPKRFYAHFTGTFDPSKSQP